MKLHSIIFFCKNKKEPTAEIDITRFNHTYPIHIGLGELGNRIDIYLSSIRDLVNFKNSFLGSYEKAMREAKDA